MPTGEVVSPCSKATLTGAPATRARRPTAGERGIAGAIALIAAFPSLLWGWTGAAYLSDDYWIAYWFDDLGVTEAMRRIAFDMPGRVLAAPYYLIVYQGIGNHPALQALVLAASNAALVLVMWRLGRYLMPTSFVLTGCLIFAVLPNRSSTRLWFVVGSYPLALILVLLGIIVLLRGRPVAAAALLAGAVLLYEGVAVFGALLVLVLVLSGRVARWGALIAGATVMVTASAVYVLSPRRASASGVGPFGAADTLGPALLGRGLTDEPLSGAIAALTFFVLVGISLAGLLPGFGRKSVLLHRIRLGAAMVLAGAAPALVGGAAFAVAGLGDRNNLVAGVGVAFVIASVLDHLRRWNRRVWAGVGAAVIAGMFVLTLSDVASYARAVDEGEAVIAAIDRSFPDEPPDDPVLVVPALDRSPGVAAFVPNIDIHGAMHLRRGGDWSSLVLVETIDCSRLETQSEWWVVDFVDADDPLRAAQGEELADSCESAVGR